MFAFKPKSMEMKMILYALVHVIVLLSCSQPLDRPFKEDNLEEDIVEIKKSLSENEAELLTGYLVVKSLDDQRILGKTYRDLLEEAKVFRDEQEAQMAEEKRLAEKAQAEERERIRRLNQALTVSIFDKGFSEYNYQEYLTYKFSFDNKTDKDIKAFTGLITLNDLFDKEISSFTLTYDKGIPAKSSKNWDAQTDYNPFIDKDVALKGKELDNLKIIWTPEKIIFEDGEEWE